MAVKKPGQWFFTHKKEYRFSLLQHGSRAHASKANRHSA
jgi:hypothetical protein